ncbi:MAG: YbaK/EbsC family protein [Kangiellaceae bacterium]|nr:YbaK/EbsC family protein [Kangiellaceae bacterium]
MSAERVLEWLDTHQLHYELFNHIPLDNCSVADKQSIERSGQRLKNLFLRDNYGRRHFLLVVAVDKQIDLKRLSNQLEVSRIGFASTQRLEKYLNVRPGHVSLLALLNDPGQQVELLIDIDVWQKAEASLAIDYGYQCHPLDNTQTVVLAQAELIKFLELQNRDVDVITVPVMDGAESSKQVNHVRAEHTDV